MTRNSEPTDPAPVSPERAAEIDETISRVTNWAIGRKDIVGLLLVGSCARGTARPDSDIDIVLLTTDPIQYSNNSWAVELTLGKPIRTQQWGPITERRYVTVTGLEVEMNIGSPDWARVDPVDSGTHRVITDGAHALHDPNGILESLIHACQP